LGQSALKFAEGKGAPMPPGTMQGRVIAKVARAPALGDLYVAQQAGKVSQVVDDEIAKYSGVGSVDDMVTAAKDMIGNKLDARSGYEGILNAVGGNTKIPLTNTTDAIRRALPQIKQTGADDLYAMVKDAGSQMESEKYFGRVLSMPFDRLNGFMTKVFQKTETANMAVADDIVNAMKADIQSAVVNNPQLAMKLQEAGGDVFKMFADANKQMRFVKAFLKEAPEVRGMLKGGTPNQFLTKFSQSPKVRELVKALDPEAHDQISKAWIAANLERLKAGNNMQGFYKFAVDNKSTIKSMFGDEQAEALQNFAAYLKVTGGFLKDADLMAQTRAMPVIAGRLWTEAKLMTPAGAAAAEAGSLGAIHSLMSPNGVLFKMFTKGLTDSELAAAANPVGNLMDFDRVSQFFTGTPAAQ